MTLPEDGMARKPCPKCGGTMEEVIHAELSVRQGWWCPACNHWDVAIGRERIYKILE